MSVIFAAGPFENPWVIAIILIVGAVANWLSQRRQAKQQEKESGEHAPAEPDEPSGDFDMEETLRRLLGETPKRPVAPPPIGPAPPQPAAARPMPGKPVVQVRPLLRPRPIIQGPPVTQSAEASKQLEADARQHDLQSAPKVSTIPVVDRRHARRSHGPRRYGWNWRHPHSVRQAFVASLVFSPPKGLEP